MRFWDSAETTEASVDTINGNTFPEYIHSLRPVPRYCALHHPRSSRVTAGCTKRSNELIYAVVPAQFGAVQFNEFADKSNTLN